MKLIWLFWGMSRLSESVKCFAVVAATTSGDGVITYAVSEAGSAGCSLSSGKLSPALMESYVSRAVEKVTAAQTEEIEVEESLRELREAYPGVKADTVADLAKLPHFDLLRGYVELGLDYREAYALSHQEEIVQQRVAAAKQQALNNANGKGHLTGTQTGDAADVSAVVVPEETMNYYRAFNPSMTDAQIKAHYAKSRKGE